MSRETAEKVAQAIRRETGASHALAVLIEVDDGPDRIDFGGSIHLAIASEDGVESRRSRIYGGPRRGRRRRLRAPLPPAPPRHRAHRFRASVSKGPLAPPEVYGRHVKPKPVSPSG